MEKEGQHRGVLRWKTCEALKIYARMRDAGYADMIETAATATVTHIDAMPEHPRLRWGSEGSSMDRRRTGDRRSSQQSRRGRHSTAHY